MQENTDQKNPWIQTLFAHWIRAISKVANNLLNFNNAKVHANDISSTIKPIVHNCIDSIAILGPVNAEPERNNQTVTCLGSHY